MEAYVKDVHTIGSVGIHTKQAGSVVVAMEQENSKSLYTENFVQSHGGEWQGPKTKRNTFVYKKNYVFPWSVNSGERGQNE